LQLKYVVIDLETTGFHPVNDRIIEIGAVKIDESGCGATYRQLVDPGMEIPAEITELTGIRQDMVCGQPMLGEALPALEDFLDGAVLIAHNASFDRGFLAGHLAQDYHWLDTLELSRIFLPWESAYSLPHLAAEKNIDLAEAHHALADAQATAGLFLLLLREIDHTDGFLLQTIAELSRGQGDFTSTWLYQLFTDRSRVFGGERIGGRQLFAADNPNGGPLFANEANGGGKADYHLDPSQVAALFLPDGRSTAELPGFEHRPPQLTMALAVTGCLNDGAHLVVEAGTGTGKSLAYLLPALLWAEGSGQKVVISTHTLNLQEQLLQKDIPLARQILDIDFRAAAVKGRSHYLCMRKWDTYFGQNQAATKVLMRRLVLWLANSPHGDVNEISLSKKELLDWQLLSAVGDTCLGVKCPYFRSRCFVARARKRADNAHLLVANHSLLLANAQLEGNLMPDYRYLVIDEAHHLEKVAEEQFGAKFTYPQAAMLLHRIKRPEGGGLPGFLDGLTGKAGRLTGLDEDLKGRLRQLAENGAAALEGCFAALREFFAAVSQFFFSGQPGPGRTVRIVEEHRAMAGWTVVMAAADNTVFGFRLMQNTLQQLSGEARFLEAEHGLELPGAGELVVLLSQLREVIDFLTTLTENSDRNRVTWVENSGEGYYPSLHSAPVEVNQLLNSCLFAGKETIIFASATLAVNRKFDFFMQRTGIELTENPCRTLLLEAPFDYRQNVLLCAVNDLPDPGKTPDLVFGDAVSAALLPLIQASQGRTLVLFTSHQQLRRVFAQVQPPLRQAGITVLGHGISGSRGRILEQFKREERSVILGANSFWEGIDVVGEALSSVIIVKMPFWPPTLPTVAARLERMKEAGQEGFYHYSLPEAVIRFKQGFGRLIRSTTDYGAVCVLDRRIYEKRYGDQFIRSLPGIPLRVDSTAATAEAVRSWLAEKSGGEKSPFPGLEKVIR